MSGWFTINAAIGMFSSKIIKPRRLCTYISTRDEKVKLYVSLTTALQSPFQGASSDITQRRQGLGFWAFGVHDMQSRFDWKIRFRI